MLIVRAPSTYIGYSVLGIHRALTFALLILNLDHEAFEWLVMHNLVSLEANETNDEIRHLNFKLVCQRVRAFRAR